MSILRTRASDELVTETSTRQYRAQSPLTNEELARREVNRERVETFYILRAEPAAEVIFVARADQ